MSEFFLTRRIQCERCHGSGSDPDVEAHLTPPWLDYDRCTGNGVDEERAKEAIFATLLPMVDDIRLISLKEIEVSIPRYEKSLCYSCNGRGYHEKQVDLADALTALGR